MPYKFATDKKKIPRDLDRRVKLTEDDKQNVRDLFRSGKYSQRAISRDTGISRRMISFILDPKKLEICQAQFKERQKDGRYKYSKDDWAKKMREHRHYKQSIKSKLI